MRTSLIVLVTAMSFAFAGGAMAAPGGNGNGNAFGLFDGHGLSFSFPWIEHLHDSAPSFTPPTLEHPQFRGDGDTQFRGAPGPIAGVGLPIVIAAGAYTWLRRRRAKARKNDSGPVA
jgi:hypothetical protein